MLMIVHDRVGVNPNIKQLDGAITTGHQELVFIDLGPGEVITGIICVKAEGHNAC